MTDHLIMHKNTLSEANHCLNNKLFSKMVSSIFTFDLPNYQSMTLTVVPQSDEAKLLYHKKEVRFE